VKGVVKKGGGDEQLLEGMHAYMDTFKQLMDTCSQTEMSRLIQQYDGLYRLTDLLERLAQGIADGVIPVPPIQAEKPKRKRPHKPKPIREPKQKQINRPISWLPTVTEYVVGVLATTEEQYQTFLDIRPNPHVLDDATVDRALRAFQTQLDDLPFMEKQLHWWLSEKLTDAQRYQVEDLLAKMTTLRTRTQEVLTLLAELKQGTINRIMGMSDEELGRKILSGEVKPPF
jgi:hypothetical protein